MSKLTNSAIKQFSIYGVGKIAQTGLSFILLPIYLHFFNPADYGAISLLTVLTTLLTIFANAGIVSGLYRLYFEPKEKEERKKLVGNTWLWYIFGGTIGGFLLVWQSGIFSQLLFGKPDYSYAIKTLGFFWFFSMMEMLPYDILRLEKKASTYVSYSILKFIVDFSLKYYFIVILGRKVEGYFESGVISSAILLVFFIPVIYKYVNFSINLPYLKQLLKLGFPFIFSTLAIWALNLSDRFILNHFSGTAEVGIYSLADKFANIFKILLFNPASLFWSPFFFSYASENTEDNTKKLLRKSLMYYFIMGAVLYIIISLGSADILKIFISQFGAKKEYINALPMIPLLTLAPFMYLLSMQGGTALLWVKKPKFIATAACIAAVTNVCLNLIFVPLLGAMGAAITTALSYLLYIILVYYWSNKVLNTNYDLKGMIKGAFFTAIVLLVELNIKINQPWVSLFVKAISGAGMFILFVWFSKILPEKEKQRVKTLITDIRNKLARRPG